MWAEDLTTAEIDCVQEERWAETTRIHLRPEPSHYYKPSVLLDTNATNWTERVTTLQIESEALLDALRSTEGLVHSFHARQIRWLGHVNLT